MTLNKLINQLQQLKLREQLTGEEKVLCIDLPFDLILEIENISYDEHYKQIYIKVLDNDKQNNEVFIPSY
jgi:hypothetical protein